jgi:hypothetical protein
VFAVQAGAALLLPVVGATTAGAVGGVIGFGIGFRVATIARPVLLAERYDTSRYATLAGVLVVPMTLARARARASATLAAAALHSTTGGYTPVLAMVAACCLLASTASTSPPRVRGAPGLDHRHGSDRTAHPSR